MEIQLSIEVETVNNYLMSPGRVTINVVLQNQRLLGFTINGTRKHKIFLKEYPKEQDMHDMYLLTTSNCYQFKSF